jgi:hypothetical protein
MPDYTDLIALADKFETKIAEALKQAFIQIKTDIKIRRVEALIQANGIAGAMQAFREMQIEGVIDAAVADQLEDAVTTSGRMTVEIAGTKIVGHSYRYNPYSELSVRAVNRIKANMVQQVSEQTRQAIAQSVQLDFAEGRNPLYTARNIRANVGLTARQELAVRNYRKFLETLDPQALERKLRDGRFDGSVLRAIESDKPLSPKQINKLVQRYRERYIGYRARTIARTEAMEAANTGRFLTGMQLIQDGVVDAGKTRKFWIPTYDAKLRDAHEAVPGLNPDGVAVDQPFVTPLGPMMYPGDPDGTAANRINCRCTFGYKLVK